jgi:predicted PurR-regulated permease PerM
MVNSYDTKIIDKIRHSSIPFVLLLFLFIILSVVVVRPLMHALLWAAALSFFTYPVYNFIYKYLLNGRYSYLAAGINTVIIFFLLVLPMLALGLAITHEATRLYSVLMNWYLGKEFSISQILAIPQLDRLISAYPGLFSQDSIKGLISNASRILASFTASMSRNLVGNAFKLVFNLVVIMVASFFMTHDGHAIFQLVRDILPLSNSSKDVFFIRCKRMLYAIFYGIILTAGIQGALGALGWWFVGLPNVFIFGALMFFLAMIPLVGTPLVWGAGAIYLFAAGHERNAILLTVWGIVMVSGIDNFLRPLFISEGSKAHLLMVFVGILGGLATWGFLGLFLGPLILSGAYFLLQIYRIVVKQHADDAMEVDGL